LSQSALARRLGMQQPAIASLEAGDHQPSLATLARLAAGLGIEFHIDITPETLSSERRRDRLCSWIQSWCEIPSNDECQGH